MPKVIKGDPKKDATHVTGDHNISDKELKLRERREGIRAKTKGVNVLTKKKKNSNSILNKIRKARVRHLSKRIESLDSN